MIKKTAAVAGAAAFVLALGACTTGSPADSGATGAGPATSTIRTAINATPTTFAPWAVRNKDDYDMARLLFNTLVRRGADNQIVPALATKWKVSPTRAVFTLRDDATCADGTKITPEIVAHSLQRFASASDSNFRRLVFGPGDPTISSDQKAGTVSVTLDQPWVDLLQGLSLEASGIVCPAGLKNVKGLRSGTVKGAFSGPYVLEESKPGVSYTLKLRDGFNAWPQYQKPAPKGEPAETIKVNVTPNHSSRANELLTGGLDIADISTKDMTRFDHEDGYTEHRLPFGSQFILFNERPGHVTADQKVRRAVVQAVSRSSFNKASTGGLGKKAVTFAHAAVPCASTDTSLVSKQNTAAAKQVLAGKTIRILGLNVVGPQGAGNTYVAEALRAAGATVKLKNVDVGRWSTLGGQKPKTWDLTVMAAINAGGTMYGALSTIVGTPTDKGGLNWTGNRHSDVLALVDKAMKEPRESSRCSVYKKVQSRLIRDADVMPLTYMPVQTTVRPGFWIGTYNGQADWSTMRITG